MIEKITNAITQQQGLITLDVFPDTPWSTISGLELEREVTKYHTGALEQIQLAGIPVPGEVTMTKPFNPATDFEIFNFWKTWNNTQPKLTIRVQPITNDSSLTPLGPAIMCNGCVPGNIMMPDLDADQPSELAVLTVTIHPQTLTIG